MTLAGNRVEWVLSLLACWRMGAVALPCNTQLRRADLEHRIAVANPALCVGDEDLLGEMPGGVECMTMAEVADALDEDEPQETPAELADLAPADPALIVFTSGTTGDPAPPSTPPATCAGSEARPSTGSAPARATWSG